MFKPGPFTQENWASKTISYLWKAFLAGLVFFVLFVWMVSINFLGLFGSLPDFKALENPDSELASGLYSSDGVLLGTFARENRSPVTYEELTPNLVKALIATEDAHLAGLSMATDCH